MEVDNQRKGFNMKTATELIVAIALLIFTAIVALSIYKYNERSMLSRNIEIAMEKGVNPLAVRCSYAKQDDAICIAYTLHESKNQATSASKK